MKFLKYFESEEQYREVDLQQLYYDYVKYKTNEDHIWIIVKNFKKDVLIPLLMDKDVKINGKCEDNYLYVRNVNINFNENDIDININYYNLLTIQRVISTINIPMIIRIYNSEETEFEKEIDRLKFTDKYNL